MEGKRALFLGRFQPFHRGHEKALSWLLARHSNVTFAIGSSNKSRQEDNPFSSSERAAMARLVFQAHNGWVKRISLRFVPDCQRHSEWMALMLRKFSPKKFFFYSNNPLVNRLFAEKGFEMRPIPLFRRYELEGAKIRQLVGSGKKYAGRIPPSLNEYMKKRGEKIITASQSQLRPKSKEKP